jgi:hypothetical protein
MCFVGLQPHPNNTRAPQKNTRAARLIPQKIVERQITRLRFNHHEIITTIYFQINLIHPNIPRFRKREEAQRLSRDRSIR